MANKDELARLRREIIARERAAARKIRRIEAEGINITGGEFDPRRNGAPINRYNSVQARNYLAKLNGFVHRRNQFVPDTWGRPIPRAEWREHKRFEAAKNKRADKLYEEYGGIKLPDGLTVAQRDAAMVNHDFPKTANAASNSPLHKHERVPKQLASRKHLKALTKNHQKAVKPEFMKALVKAGRSDANKMLDELGDSATKKELRGLTDKQFHVLWAYTELPNLISRRYERKKEDANDRAALTIEAGDQRDTKEWIEWAKTIEDNPTAKTPRSRKRR